MTLNPNQIAERLAAEISTRADSADRAGCLPAEDAALLRESGFLALPIPRRYGGPEASMQAITGAYLRLAMGSASTALVAAMTLNVIGHARDGGVFEEDCTAELSRLVLQDGALLNIVASEPVMGSPSRGHVFATRAEQNPHTGEWHINGHKTWVTGGRHLTHLLIRLMVDGEPGVILLPNDGREGIRWEETWADSLSLRASDSHDLHLTDVRVSSDAILQRGGEKGPINAWFPMLIGATYLGSALAARDRLIQFAWERIPTALGQPIATLPKIQRQIGQMEVELKAAQALMMQAAAAWDDSTADTRSAIYADIVAAKHFAIETALKVTEWALQAAGGQSLTHHLPLERYFRDVRAGSMQPPAGDTALEIVGRGVIERQKP